MAPHRGGSLGRKIFVRALIFFPPAFRARYREELVATFDHQMERLSDAGWLRRSSFLATTLVDTAVSGIGQRFAWNGGTALTQALSFTLRGARRAPGFTLSVVVTLGLGIGATTMMYGIVDRLLLSPPEHVVDADRVANVYFDRISPFLHTRGIEVGFSYPDLEDLESVDAFESIAGFTATRLTLGHGARAEHLHAQQADARLFDLLGVRPEVGRFYTTAEDRVEGGALVAVLSDAFWTRRFGRDPAVLGRTLAIGAGTYTVVGVAPPGFTGATIEPVDLWLPLRSSQVAEAGEDWTQVRGWVWFQTVVRLRDGVTREAAEAEATAAHLAGRRDQISAGRYDEEARVVLGSIIPGQSPEAGGEVPVARWLAGVAALVMLIGCANVANLLLLRAVRRRREIAIRIALGASRRRLFMQLMVESLALATAAAAAALFLARWGGTLVYRVLLPDLDPGRVLGSPRLLLFAGGAAALATLAAGLVPAALASRPDVQRDLKEAERGLSSSRLRSGLVVVQVGLSVVLLAGAGLFLRSLSRAHHLDLGFSPDHVLVGRIETEQGSWGNDAADAVRVAMTRLREAPGVEGTAVSSLTPFGGWWGVSLIRAAGDTVSLARGPYYYVTSPGYFRVMGMRILRGRGFTPADTVAGAPPVMVITQGLASQVFGAADPVGQCLIVEQSTGPAPCSRIVGLLADHRSRALVEDPSNLFYVPLGHPAAQSAATTLVARTAGDSRAVIPLVHRVLLQSTPSARYASVVPLTDRIDALTRSWRLGATLFVLFGLLALCVAALGLHAVISFEVAQRRNELGIRAALGAGRRGLVWLVFRSTMARTIVGVALGLLVVLAAAADGGDLLFHTSPTDPVILGVVCFVLLGVAGLAAAHPAARAAGVEPAEALQE